MLKKKWLLALICCLMVSTIVGCGKKKSEEQSTESGYDYSSVQTDENGVSTVEGIMSEKKDFMFTLEDKTGAAYAFSFEEKPASYEKFNDGDRIVVEFTGEISEVDPFTGEIKSIKWKQ